jgi:hypothetical protein
VFAEPGPHWKVPQGARPADVSPVSTHAGQDLHSHRKSSGAGPASLGEMGASSGTGCGSGRTLPAGLSRPPARLRRTRTRGSRNTQNSHFCIRTG